MNSCDYYSNCEYYKNHSPQLQMVVHCKTALSAWCDDTCSINVITCELADHFFPNPWWCRTLAVEPHGRSGPGNLFFWWSMRAFFFFFFFFFFPELAVPSRKPAARSSKSIDTQCGQMTTRLVWRPTSFHNMWPGLLNWRQGLREKIFPCTKSDLAAGGPWSCEWAASTPAKDCGARTLYFSPPRWLSCTSHWFNTSVVSGSLRGVIHQRCNVFNIIIH